MLALLFHVQLNIVSRVGMISIQCSMFSEWALWGCLTAVFVFVVVVVFVIVFVFVYVLMICVRCSVSEDVWQQSPHSKITFQGEEGSGRDKDKSLDFCNICSSVTGTTSNFNSWLWVEYKIHQRNYWMTKFFLLQKLLPCLCSLVYFTKTPFFAIHIALSWLLVLGPNMDPNTAKYAKYSTWGA